MIIFGTMQRAKFLAVLFTTCMYCEQDAGQRLIRRTTWFTLFFVPLFPFAFSHWIHCAYCGASYRITKDNAQRFSNDANHQAEQHEALPTDSE